MDTDIIVETISETLLIGSQEENESSYVHIYAYTSPSILLLQRLQLILYLLIEIASHVS